MFSFLYSVIEHLLYIYMIGCTGYASYVIWKSWKRYENVKNSTRTVNISNSTTIIHEDITKDTNMKYLLQLGICLVNWAQDQLNDMQNSINTSQISHAGEHYSDTYNVKRIINKLERNTSTQTNEFQKNREIEEKKELENLSNQNDISLEDEDELMGIINEASG